MSVDLKLGNDFLRVPKLSADGKGFVVWKERLELSVRARGLFGHLDGTIIKPSGPPTRPSDAATALKEQAIVFQQIASTIPDSLYLKIKGKPTVKEAWDALKGKFEKRSRMITIDLRKHLYDVCCAENGNVRTHFDNIRGMREELASLGTVLGEPDFSAVILGSLLKKDLEPDDLMQTVIDEYDRRSTRSGTVKDKGSDVAFYAGGARDGRGGGAGKKPNKDMDASIATRKDIGRLTVGQKAEEKRDKAQDRKRKEGRIRMGSRRKVREGAKKLLTL